MNEFWDFQNAAGDDNAELYIYGDIVAEAPLWSDSVDAAKFSRELQDLGGKTLLSILIRKAAMCLWRTLSIIS